jgi:hypothetical protein
MAPPDKPDEGASFPQRLDQLRFGIWGMCIVIALAFIMAWGVIQYGPFELRADENRDYQELREQRSDDKEAQAEQLKQVNESVQDVARTIEDIKKTNEQTALDIKGIQSELTFELPPPASHR